MGCLGGNSAAKTQNKQIEKTYEYDTKVYDFNWATQADIDASLADDDPEKPETLKNNITQIGQAWQKFEHQKEGQDIAKANDQLNKKYQMDTQNQAWKHGLAIQEFQFDKQMEAFNKSEETFGNQLGFNEAAMKLAMERERQVLDEEFTAAAFDHQELVQDLFEATGAAGFDKVSTKLGLKDTEGMLDYQKTGALTKLKQDMSGSRLATAKQQIAMTGKAGSSKFSKDITVQDAMTKEGMTTFDKYALGIDVKDAKSKADFENDLIRREISNAKAKNAFNTTEANIEALKKLGAAQASGAGRSKGKQIQIMLAEVGRQNQYNVESLIRGEKIADARAKENRRTALTSTAKSNVALDKLDLSSLDNLTRTKLQTEEIDRDLNISNQTGDLDLEGIRKGVLNAMENTNLDVKEAGRKLDTARNKAGFSMKKTDWDLTNTGSKFKTNVEIIEKQLENAAKASALNVKDITIAKIGADMRAEAARMLKPTRAPTAPKPIPLPELEWQDPLAPSKPPEPIKGAKADAGGITNALSSAASGISTGAAVAAGLKGAGMVAASANPIGLAIGLGVALFG
tara:strand:- start:4060 stop:5772 length:1713 start_codon:yes stop_codon:yes gene_type:complete